MSDWINKLRNGMKKEGSKERIYQHALPVGTCRDCGDYVFHLHGLEDEQRGARSHWSPHGATRHHLQHLALDRASRQGTENAGR